MEYTIVKDELYHHGVKGQHWGVRRYQNEDGSLTSAGKRREESSSSNQTKKHLTSDQKKKIAIGVGAGVASAAAIAAVVNPKSRAIITDFASKSSKQVVDKMKSQELHEKAKGYVKDVGKATLNGIKKGSEDAGRAMVSAAIVSVGTIAIGKISKKYESSDSDSQATKNANQVKKDVATAGVEAVINPYRNGGSSNKNNQNRSNSNNADYESAVGKPSGKRLDKNSEEYSNLFKNDDGTARSKEERDHIRSMNKAGYDANQIKSYLKTAKHGWAAINDIELYHHGVKGQHWGVRRYQNEDGSLVSKGQRREESNTRRTF